MLVHNLNTDGLAIAVLAFPHEWSAELAVSHRFPSSITPGQSGRESRRPKDEGLRFEATVHLVLRDEEAQELRQILATIGAGFIGLPLWIDQLEGSDWADRIYEPERIIDLTAGAILEKGDALEADHIYAPLLIGRVHELPELRAQNQDRLECSFKVVEDAPLELAWAFRIGINETAEPGNWPDGLAPDWVEDPVDQPTKPLEFSQIGDHRGHLVQNDEVAFRWGQSANFVIPRRESVAALLAFFVACEGPRRKFTTPWWLQPGDATAEAPALTDARFAVDVITLEYIDAGIARATLRVLQVPWELVPVDGEAPEQPPRVFFYRFTHAIPEPQVFRFTNWPRPLERTADGLYTPGPFRHSAIRETLDLKGSGLTIESFNFPGNPLMLFRPDRLEAPLLLEVFESETWPVDPDAAVLRWSGEVKRPRYDGKRISAPVKFMRGLLEREVPGVLASIHCQTEFGSRRCGKNLDDFKIEGTFTSAAGCVLDIATADASPFGFFAFGAIEIGAGATWEQRAIVGSEPIDGGQRLTIDWPVRQAAAGQAVSFRRGCNRTWTMCDDLENTERFAGLRNMPNVNLVLPTMALPNAPGKK